MNRTTWLCIPILLCLGAGQAVRAGEQGGAEAARPAVLFCTWSARPQEIDYDYLQQLSGRGLTIDYLDRWADLSWNRIRAYNAIVLFGFPFEKEGRNCSPNGLPVRGPDARELSALLSRFMESGGGVGVCINRAGHCPESWQTTQQFLGRWGAKLPMELVTVSPASEVLHERLRIHFCYTSNIAPSPVSDGVQAIWWPNAHRMRGINYIRFSGPLEVAEDWTVVVRAPRGSRSRPCKPAREESLAPDMIVEAPYVREGGVEEPALFAIRDLAPGRLALFHALPVFHLASGTRWLHGGAMLDKGLNRRGSDFGQLIENTFAWLAEPSLKSGKLGGATVAPERLMSPVLRPGRKESWGDPASPPRVQLDPDAPVKPMKLMRGLIGARTVCSGGKGKVTDYAAAARGVGLDFVVFLEDASELTEDELQQLTADCRSASTEALHLVPGFRMETNLASRMFFFGDDPVYPHEKVLSRREPGAFRLQAESQDGEYDAGDARALDFLLRSFMGGGRERTNNVGFYDFRRTMAEGGIAMYHARLFGAAAVMFYQDGKLVEDVTDQYLRTNAGTMPCVPVVVNLVDSPDELVASVERGDAMTVVAVPRAAQVMVGGLHKNHQFQSLPVSVSSGPLIRLWPRTKRSSVYGNEDFVNGLGVLDALLHVTSERGLHEVVIYDGERILRRLLPEGAGDLQVRFYLSGFLQRNMSVVATDTEGGKAVSFPLRAWKSGTTHQPVFCGDHVNHCTSLNMKMARGPLEWPMRSFAAVPAAGSTWDGGPVALRPIVGLTRAWPTVWAADGISQGGRQYQHPDLIFADERVYRGRSVMDGYCAVNGNAWSGWGPIEPAKLFGGESVLTEFSQYADGVDPTSWGAPAAERGPILALYEQVLRFKRKATVGRIRLSYEWRRDQGDMRAMLISGRGDTLLSANDLTPTGRRDDPAAGLTIPTGGWWAGVSPSAANCYLAFNRGAPLTVLTSGHVVELGAQVPPEGLSVEPGTEHRVEMLTVCWPLDMSLVGSQDVLQVVRWLAAPEGLQLTRGRRIRAGAGLFEIEADDRRCALSVPRPKNLPVEVTLPVRVHGLNPRWSAGLFQVRGFGGQSYYSRGRNVYRPLGVDRSGRAYVPLYASKAPTTELVIGHPVVADEAGDDLFIQVTALTGPHKKRGMAPDWHVFVNNPTDEPVRTAIRRAMDLPGLDLPETEIELAPGEYRVLLHTPKSPTAKKR